MAVAAKLDLVGQARQLGPTLRANAERSDREGHLAKESLDAMREAGFLRMYAPRSLGGLEVDPVTHAQVQEELARHDSAAAWVLQVASPSAWFVSRLPTETAREIYASGPDPILATSFGIPVECRAVEGGFRLSGQRTFASFAADASWHWLTALNMQDGGPEMVDGNPIVRGCFFPASDDHIVQTWDTLGMRGTDSDDLRVEDLFVPEARTFRVGIDHSPGPLYDGPLYRMAVMGMVAAALPPVALGVAREAIDELVALASGKTPFSSATTLRERGVVQSKVGKAEGLLRSARAYLYDRIVNAWETAEAGGELTLEEKTEALLASVQAIAASVEATDLVYSAAGTTGIHKRNRLERLFRDAQVLRHHGFVSESRYETVGQVWMGLPPELGFVAL
jgi:alkylation response protein AidB-like acyl-CoA dehydrogenase